MSHWIARGRAIRTSVRITARVTGPVLKRSKLLMAFFVAFACLGSPTGATALTFDFSGQPILGGDNPSFQPDVTAEFMFDETCMTASCILTITLTYNDSGGLSTIGESLSGVVFDAFSNGSPIDLAVILSSSAVDADSLVGAGSDDALSDFGAGSNNNVDVSGHWGFVSGHASSGSLGSNVFSSVGDVFPDTGALGAADVFSGIVSSVEFNPPDGTPFSIVDDNTCTGPPGMPTCSGLTGGFQDSNNRAWIQNEVTGTLVYDGTTNKLTGVGNVDPLFGTEGRILVPEPATAPLAGLGVLGLGYFAERRRHRRRAPSTAGPSGLR
ncbi:MAG: hypothetical protein ACR2QM_09380 [Longimicrobiales bacterium]